MHEVKRGTASRVISGLIAAIAVLLVVVACGSSSSTTAGGSSTTAGSGGANAASAPNTIMIKDFAFSPPEVTVSPGAKVMVLNQDTATHTVTANDKAFDTGNVAPSQTGEFTAPSTPGSYPFRCTPHPYMTGTLIVK